MLLWNAAKLAGKLSGNGDGLIYDFSAKDLHFALRDPTKEKPIEIIHPDAGKALQVFIDQQFFDDFVAELKARKREESLRAFLFLFPEFDSVRNQLTSAHLKMLMPEIYDEHGGEKKIDVILNSEWKDYTAILEDPFKSQGFIKITKKGLKTMTTVPIRLLLETSEDEWEQIREGILQLKLDADLQVINEVVELKPDIGIKKLILVYNDEEMGTEQDAVKALVNLMIS